MSSIKNYSDERQLLEKELRELAQNVQTYTMYMYSMVPRSEMDLMFIVDCTGSMGSWITAVKNEILTIVKGIKAQFQTSCLRLSFVGYRDHCDKKTRFSIQPFQTDWRSFKKFVSSVKASGGGDAPEDVFGGFKNALEQQWASSAKYAIFIADAPCHGTKYHDIGGDSYPQGDPSGEDMEHFMKEFADKGVNLFSARIDKGTDKMMKIFSDEYKKYMKQEIGQADLTASANDFSKFIVRTALQILEKESDQVSNLKASMESVYYRVIIRMRQNTQFDQNNKLFADKYSELLLAIKNYQENNKSKTNSYIESEEVVTSWKQEVNEEFNFHLHKQPSNTGVLDKLLENFKGLFSAGKEKQNKEHRLFDSITALKHTFSVVTNDKGIIEWQNPLKFKSETQQINVNLGILPFAKGTSNYVYALKDSQRRVLRVPIDFSKCSHDVESFIEHNKQQLIAQLIIAANGKQSNFCAYELTVQDKIVLVGSEDYLDNNKYVSYDSMLNFQPCNFDKQGITKQALSHFSYQHTQGQYFIANYVTEENSNAVLKPLLYSRHFENLPLATNQGYIGMFKFFINHSCADECSNKQLIDLEEFSDPGKYNFKLPIEEVEESKAN